MRRDKANSQDEDSASSREQGDELATLAELEMENCDAEPLEPQQAPRPLRPMRRKAKRSNPRRISK